MTTKAKPKRTLGIMGTITVSVGVFVVGTLIVSRILFWTVANNPQLHSGGTEVTSISSSAFDWVLRQLGTDRTKTAKALALVNRMVDAAEAKAAADAQPKSAELSNDATVPAIQGYPAAYARAKESNKPLLVLIGAKWCGYCEATRKNLIKLIAAGKLDGIEVAYIDEDKDPKSAKLLKDPNDDSIPQLIWYGHGGPYFRKGETDQSGIMELIDSAKPQPLETFGRRRR
jgi:thiol-disulfide isomerase/thioredoxin